MKELIYFAKSVYSLYSDEGIMQIEIVVENNDIRIYDKERNVPWVRYEYNLKLYKYIKENMDYLNEHEDARWAIDMILVKILLCILVDKWELQ